jgi:hypothetical protein
MKVHTLKAVSAAFALNRLVSTLPSHVVARQSIDFDLVDSTPDPTIKPDNTTNLNPAAAIASVIAEVKANPLPQDKRSLQARDIVVSTYAGYTANQAIGNAAINAPLDCNKKVSTPIPCIQHLCLRLSTGYLHGSEAIHSDRI